VDHEDKRARHTTGELPTASKSSTRVGGRVRGAASTNDLEGDSRIMCVLAGGR